MNLTNKDRGVFEEKYYRQSCITGICGGYGREVLRVNKNAKAGIARELGGGSSPRAVSCNALSIS